MTETLEQQLIRHEGLKLKPYRCTAGKLTIGVGRNIEDVGISESEAICLLINDIDRCRHEVISSLPWAKNLPYKMQDVLINMCFNMGMLRLLGFKKFLNALNERNYTRAAEEMLDSLWAEQVGNRAIELSEIIKKGV